jgi:hypothetical protein
MDDRGALLNSWEWSTGSSIDSVTLFERQISWSTRESGFSMFETGESQTLDSYLETGPVWEAPNYILSQLNEEIEKSKARKKNWKSDSGK